MQIITKIIRSAIGAILMFTGIFNLVIAYLMNYNMLIMICALIEIFVSICVILGDDAEQKEAGEQLSDARDKEDKRILFYDLKAS